MWKQKRREAKGVQSVPREERVVGVTAEGGDDAARGDCNSLNDTAECNVRDSRAAVQRTDTTSQHDATTCTLVIDRPHLTSTAGT